MKFFILIIISSLIYLPSFAQNYEVELNKIWTSAKKEIYPQSLVKIYFTSKNYQRLQEKIKNVQQHSDFENIINDFLLNLGVSHTQLYTNENTNYSFFRSLFTTKKLNEPKIWHIGAQTKKHGNVYYLRSVLKNYPAERSGLSRGDKLLSVNGKDFHPFHSFNSSLPPYRLNYERNGLLKSTIIEPIFENPHLSFVEASKESSEILNLKSFKVGYFHLWTGTHKKALDYLSDAVMNKFKNTDALIIDLRDGFGGAWWAYLDPFYPNRDNYFIATVKNKSSKEETLTAPKKTNIGYYDKPIVILSNEGVRSGKEALVHQFKKTKRAKVIGTLTGGMFSAGKGIFADKNNDYILYLSVAEYFLDGKKIEGVGISPDIKIAYPFNVYHPQDPQLEAAKSEILKLL